MDNLTFDDYKNSLILKNHLLGMNTDSLLELYKDPSNYLGFLNTISVMSENDIGFFFLTDEVLERIQYVLELNRFSMKDDSDIYETINDMIGFTNSIKNTSEDMKTLVLFCYLKNQESLRNITIQDQDHFGNILVYDGYVLVELINHSLDKVKNDTYFLSSINYFLEIIPTLFDDEEVSTLVNDRIKKIKRESKLLSKNRKYSNYTEKNYQKIKKI